MVLVFLALIFFIFILPVLASSIRVVFEFQRGIVFRFGSYSRILKPGLNFIIPFVETVRIADLRLLVSDVPEQSPITKDNVSIRVDAVIYYRIVSEHAENSVIKIDNYQYAISQLAQTTMRNIIGEMNLDEILSETDKASKMIKEIVDVKSDPWGIKVEAVELKHVELPDSMKKIMAKAAEAERIKRAQIIKSGGEALASNIIAKASEVLTSVEGGLNLRTLQVLGCISSDPSNDITFYVPIDTIKPIQGYGGEEKK
jgi:regulator of protease activity HflC (stomatin/prohibitin superfamily)